MTRSSLRLAALTVLASVAIPATAVAAGPTQTTTGAARTGAHAVTVKVSSSGGSAPYYRAEVHNESPEPLDVVVRQGVPAGTAVAAVSDGGYPARDEVTWRVRLVPGETLQRSTSLAPAGTMREVVVPVCAYPAQGDQPYDCASATWAAPPLPVVKAAPPWWMTLPALIASIGVVLLAAAILTWRRWSKPRRLARAERFRREMPRYTWRYGPPVWTLVLLSAAMVTAVGALAAWQGVVRFDRASETTRAALEEGKGWIGDTTLGQLGAPMREQYFEFAVYRVTCEPPAGGKGRCLAVVGLRNVSGESQPWYGMLQRAYQPNGNWVSVDEEATRAVNGGRDLFATPVPAGEKLLFPLAFTVDGGTRPDRIELRGGVFSAGVTVRLP
ncbi:hypothetical protein [Polymorphospora sp. NPDC050346]|uniref:hypothetical protein n=1 Tax=Polymorphospora sp. NPDC050346 TaxID=3155780 RepID=UPI0033F207E1